MRAVSRGARYLVTTDRGDGAGRRLARRTGGLLLGHGLFALLLLGACGLRWTAIRGFPSMLLFGDSPTYLRTALDDTPSQLRPGGYSIFLRLLRPFHDFTVVLTVQHALGLLAGTVVYALVWRGVRAAWPGRIWVPGLVAAPAAVPVLYDAYVVQLEHMLLSDSLFTCMLVLGVAVIMWRRRMPWWAGALTGLIFSCAALVRSVGLPMLAVALVCMAARRAGWRPVAAAVGAAVFPIAAYMTWFHSAYGTYALTSTDKIWLYGRTVDFAKCTVIKPRPEVAILCRDGLPRDPAVAPAFQALWGEDSGFAKLPARLYDPQANELAGEFATAAITKQPGDYVKVIWRDTFRAFEPGRAPYPTPDTAAEYEFPVGASIRDREAVLGRMYGGSSAAARVVEPYGQTMRDYQDWAYLPGPALGAFMAIGLAGVLLRARRFGGDVLLPWSTALALLVVPAATADFDYRYVLPAIPFAMLAAGLTFAFRPSRRATTPAPEAAKVSLLKAEPSPAEGAPASAGGAINRGPEST
ncbi:hypothetical protein [Actinomadura macrotermitis]|uniref:Glycosyltransferase RgtA/B/C/D-like domain-containing protein n=1 Tax=Actinomadura macrotermitis TaxID=2585200 RepID=A0A7K0C179_9ACTN|nr:hypothetical protein [Actinomadura macrotermitis]MQY07189.1 hypothetical protein [Actinomadura macrotermitis]